MKIETDSSPLTTPTPLPETDNSPKAEFLRLLVAQMQHQDPLEPQDGSEFVAQLAQFANIELGVETNTHLAALETGQMSASRASLMGLVGKNLTADGSQFRLGATGDIPDMKIDLAGKATKVEIKVYDDAGNVVATIDGQPHPAGEFTVPWDGLDDNGVRLPEGDYTIEVLATDGKEGVVDATVAFSGTTTSVEFAEDGSTLLGLGGVLISPAAIQSVANAA